MFRLFEPAARRVHAFLDQRDEVALVLRAGDEQTMPLLKILETVDDERGSELPWTHTGDFQDAVSYVEGIVQEFVRNHDLMREIMPKQGLTPWPSLPAAVLTPGAPPVERFRALMTFSRSLLPAPSAGLSVWILFPVKNANPGEFAVFLRELLRHQFPFPWFHRLRLIVREDPAAPIVHAGISQAAPAGLFAPDFSTDAMAKAFEDQIEDESLPLESRMQALLVSAMTDASHQRDEQALRKYQILFDHYHVTDDPQNAALVLNGLGEIARRKGDLRAAGAFFEGAIGPVTAVKEPPPVLLFNIFRNLADVRMQERRLAEAEFYFDSAQQLASVVRHPEMKIEMVERLGEARFQQGKTQEAAETWNLGAMIAEKLEKPGPLRQLLGKLAALYGSTNDPRLRDVSQRLARMGGAG